jgi:RNA polymerase sigma-70 factor (ECF subfamily)
MQKLINTIESETGQDVQSVHSSPAEWLEAYGDLMFRYAYLQLRDREKAEDAVQDALLSAYKAIDGFEGKSSIKTWLMTILRNKIIDIVRKDKRDRLVGVDSYDDPIIGSNFNSMGIWSKWLSSWGDNPESLYEHKGFLERVENCMEKLPDNLRQVFILRNVDGLSTEEICEQLDISPNNLWVMLYRSRLRMRECLDKNWFKVKK